MSKKLKKIFQMCFSKATHSSFWSISTAAAVAVDADNVDAAFNFKTPFNIPAILLLLFPRKKSLLKSSRRLAGGKLAAFED